MEFVHFHNHSEYSSLDGGSRISDMPEKLRSMNMKAMGLTDHGVMQGLPDFYKKLKSEGIKPILGLEAYLTNDRFDKSKGTPTWHLTLIAETTEGYHNLCKISSRAFIDGTIITFGRPRARADWDLLETYSKGIIAFTGCMAGPVMGSIFAGDITAAEKHTERLIEIFGKENVYGEIQNVGIEIGISAESELAKKLGKTPLTAAQAEVHPEAEAGEITLSQTEANRELAEICSELGLALVATGDTHYLNESDADPHDSMICIGTGQLKHGNRRFSLLPKKYHMRSAEEMLEAHSEWPESISNTVKIAERCNAEIIFGKELLPAFPIPDGFEGSQDYLRHLCDEGLANRYGDEADGEPRKRLDYELSVIDNMGFNDYFLIVGDLLREARERKIPSGPGRGSAAGSIVAYSLGITQLDPLKYGLLFERFLNPDRISMPDVDLDFGVQGRNDLIQYAADKYNALAGCDTAVAQIVTFGKYAAKGALRDAARVLAEPSDEGRRAALNMGDRIAGMVPKGVNVTMTMALDENDGKNELNNLLKRGGPEADAIGLARWLEGFVRTNGIHAAAVIIASHDLSDDLPLQKFGADKPLHVQYDMKHAEALGLLKMDFLGLRNLDIIDDAIERVKHTRGIELHPYKIPLDDANTYEMFSRGESVATFQFECVAGDTIIGGGSKTTIASMYENPPEKLWSIDPQTGERKANEVLQVIKSGEKQLYKLSTDDAHILRATADHKILTYAGWKKLGQIRPGEKIMINSKNARFPVGKKIKLHPDYGYSSVKSIEADAIEMTYDIAMRAPLNNYVANGIVVHNSSGMQSALKEVKPTVINDLIALVALYRPGPMQNIPTYAARKNGREKTTYLNEKLEPILGETWGVTIYQEQNMVISKELAGFTPGQADDLRKAIGKKLRDKMEQLKVPFMDGCEENGISRSVAEELWDDNERAADYSFNKSHAACYGYVAYVTGYLKANFPEEYMAAVLSAVMGHKDKPRTYLTEAKRMGLKVLPPDVNRSHSDYMVLPDGDNPDGFEVLFGLTAIKGVGQGVVEQIRAEREEYGAFAGLFDIVERMPQLNKSVLQNLARAGALDAIGPSRKGMAEAVEPAIEAYKKRKKEEEKALVVATREALGKDNWKALIAPEKRGYEAAAKATVSNRSTLDEEIAGQAAEDAIRKDYLREARAEERRKLKAHAEHTAGIADEEASGTLDKDLVEERAAVSLKARAKEIKASVADVRSKAADAVRAALSALEGTDDGLSDALASIAPTSGPSISPEEWEEIEKLNVERSMLGVYVTGHPLDKDESIWWHYLNQGSERGREIAQLSEADIGKQVIIVGAVVGDQLIPMKKGGHFHKTQLEDLSGSVEITIFKDALEGGLDTLIEAGKIVCIDAQVKEDTFKKNKASEAEEEIGADEVEEAEVPIQLVASRIYRWDAEKFQKSLDARMSDKVLPIKIKLRSLEQASVIADDIKEICAQFPGASPVKIVCDGKTYKTQLTAEDGREFRERISMLITAVGARTVDNSGDATESVAQ